MDENKIAAGPSGGGALNAAVMASLVKGPYREQLEELAKGRCTLHFYNTVDELLPVAGEMDIFIGSPSPDPALYEKAVKLKWMQSGSAGVEAYIDIFKGRRTAILTNASGAYGQGIAEYMLAYVLILLKHIPQYVRGQNEHEWRGYGQVRNIEGSLVVVVGLGDLGGNFARKMSLLGARVRGVRYSPGPKPDYLEALYTREHLDDALEGADIVALCLPNTPATDGIMSRDRLFAMKQGAILLNTGRGNAIDQEALCDVLREKRIYAGLDVTVPEPLPRVHPMWDLENLFLTPHITGGPSSMLASGYIGGLVVRNMRAYLDGRPLENVVDIDRGY